MPTQDQALQQVVMLKKELAEMRANQALAEDRIIASATSLDREVGKVRGMITPANPEAEMERSAHRETLDALESSESTVSRCWNNQIFIFKIICKWLSIYVSLLFYLSRYLITIIA